MLHVCDKCNNINVKLTICFNKILCWIAIQSEVVIHIKNIKTTIYVSQVLFPFLCNNEIIYVVYIPFFWKKIVNFQGRLFTIVVYFYMKLSLLFFVKCQRYQIVFYILFYNCCCFERYHQRCAIIFVLF